MNDEAEILLHVMKGDQNFMSLQLARILEALGLPEIPSEDFQRIRAGASLRRMQDEAADPAPYEVAGPTIIERLIEVEDLIVPNRTEPLPAPNNVEPAEAIVTLPETGVVGDFVYRHGHVHNASGECIKNRYGPRCGDDAGPAPVEPNTAMYEYAIMPPPDKERGVSYMLSPFMQSHGWYLARRKLQPGEDMQMYGTRSDDEGWEKIS